MIAQGSVLVQLVRLLDCAPAPTSTRHPRRGRPTTYPDGLFLKALVVMALKRLHRVGELLAVLREPAPEMIPCANCSPSGAASPPGAPSSAGCAP